MQYFLFLLIALLLLLHRTADGLPEPHLSDKMKKIIERASEDCRKKVHPSYNKEFKNRICDFNSTTYKYGTGPADCVSLAKDKLHVPPADAETLCSQAYSSAPVLCVLALPMAHRKQYGLDLCKNDEYKLQGVCLAELLETKFSNKLGTSVTITQKKEFCSNLTDTRSPIDCLSAAVDTKILTGKQSMEVCSTALSQEYKATSQCLYDMRRFIGNSQLHLLDIGRFCAQLMPELYDSQIAKGMNLNIKNPPVKLSNYSSVQCFFSSKQFESSTSSDIRTLTVKNRLDLCLNSPGNYMINSFNRSESLFGEGPIVCMKFLQENGNKWNGVSKKLSIDDMVSLCQFALGEGPAQCFFEAQHIKDFQTKITLCKGSLVASPASCHFKALSAFKNDPSKALDICIGAMSDAPGFCAVRAPLSFTDTERMNLCSKSVENDEQNNPVKCFQAVESSSKVFIKNSVGSIKSLTDYNKLYRNAFISFCSYAVSHNPGAAAECLKAAPSNLIIDEVLTLCTNITSNEVLAHKLLCMRVLQSGWTSTEASVVCENVNDAEVAKAVAKCAVDLQGQTKTLTLGGENVSKQNVSSLCKHENKRYVVTACVNEALKFNKASPSANRVMTLDNLIAVCAGKDTQGEKSGKCLASLVSQGDKLSFSNDLPRKLCTMPNPLNKLVCLENLGRKEVSADDIKFCENEVRIATHIKLIKLQENKVGEPFVTAGKSFSIYVQILDQYMASYSDGDKLSENVFVSINENNMQGAVLWGSSKNSSSSDGRVQFSSLIISQAGDLELKFYKLNNGDKKDKVTLGLFALTVRADPDVVDSQPCLSIFRLGSCMTSEQDYDADFPRMKGFLTPVDCSTAIQFSKCYGVLDSWGVSSYFHPDGSCFVDYKIGIDSIWTGIDLPNEFSSLESRLGLTFPLPTANITKKVSKSLQKEANKAYKKKALMWHPDRWAAYPRYIPIVQGVFEIVREGYESVIKLIADLANLEKLDETVSS